MYGVGWLAVQKQIGGPGASGGQQRPDARRPAMAKKADAFTTNNQPLMDSLFRSDESRTKAGEARFKEALHRFYFQRLSGDWLCRMVNGLEPVTAAGIAEFFNKPENTCTDPASDKDAFLRSRLAAGHITINDQQVLGQAILFLQINAGLYAARKSVFESLDALIGKYVERPEKAGALAWFSRKDDAFSYREKAVAILEMAHDDVSTRELGRLIRKTIRIAIHHPDLCNRNYSLGHALDDLSSALGGMKCEKLRTVRAALGSELRRTSGTVRKIVRYEKNVGIACESGVSYVMGPVYGDVPVFDSFPKIVLREKLGRKLARFAAVSAIAAAVAWCSVGYFFNFPPPQRFIIPSQRAELVSEFREYAWQNPIEALQSAEDAYRHARHWKAR